MPYTLITGASKGIGQAMARECAQKKMDLILVARSLPELEKLAQELRQKHQIDVLPYALDLSDPQAPQFLFRWCEEKKLPISMLINNAGCGYWGAFGDLPLEKQADSVELNVNALVAMTHAFLPVLGKNKPAFILNVASVAGFVPMPYFAVYAATKAFVVSFSRALRRELERADIKVSCLCPGPTESEFFDRAGMTRFRWNRKKLLMTAEEVARIAVKETLKGKELIIPGLSNKAGTVLGSAIPHSLVAKVIGFFYKP